MSNWNLDFLFSIAWEDFKEKYFRIHPGVLCVNLRVLYGKKKEDLF